MSRIIQRTRITKENPPVNPSNANDLIIPEIYKFTNKNELFLSYDSGNNECRILIFTTKSNLNLLQESDNWLGDETFKTVPSIFSQLYTIHSYKSDCVVPLVYIKDNNLNFLIHSRLSIILFKLLNEVLPWVRLR